MVRVNRTRLSNVLRFLPMPREQRFLIEQADLTAERLVRADLSDNPMVTLNHAIAAAMVHGVAKGLEL